MNQADTLVRPQAEQLDMPSRLPLVLLAAAIRSLIAMAAGLVLTSGVALLIWAVTPSSGTTPTPLLRGGAAAFAAAHGMHVIIGRNSVTLAPLLLTVIVVSMLAAVTVRGRLVPSGLRQELIAVPVAAGVYGTAVVAVGRFLAPAGAISAAGWWRPEVMAMVVVGAGTVLRGHALREACLRLLPTSITVAFRAAAVGVATLLGGGAVALTAGLAKAFSSASSIAALAAPGAGGGLGVFLLGAAFAPNAAVSGAGMVTGVGFSVGSGRYSIFGSTTTNLPAVPLLAALPSNHGLSKVGLALLAFPLLAALLIGFVVIRRLDRRLDRVAAAAMGSVLTGAGLAVAASMASGGIEGGPWATSGAPLVALAVAAALELGLISAAVAGLARPAESGAAEIENGAYGVGAGGEAQSAATAESTDGGPADADVADGDVVAATEVDVGDANEVEAGQTGDQVPDDPTGAAAADSEASVPGGPEAGDGRAAVSPAGLTLDSEDGDAEVAVEPSERDAIRLADGASATDPASPAGTDSAELFPAPRDEKAASMPESADLGPQQPGVDGPPSADQDAAPAPKMAG